MVDRKIEVIIDQSGNSPWAFNPSPGAHGTGIALQKQTAGSITYYLTNASPGWSFRYDDPAPKITPSDGSMTFDKTCSNASQVVFKNTHEDKQTYSIALQAFSPSNGVDDSNCTPTVENT
jgi:hypothetical protein